MRVFKIEVTGLVTLWTHLEAICKAKNIDWRLSNDEAEVRAPSVKAALEEVRQRIDKIYRAKFPGVFGDDSILVNFNLYEGDSEAIVKTGYVQVGYSESTLAIDKPRVK